MSAPMKYWDEVRTVAKVARLGTISAAARELGIHRATVQRHVEQMEQHLRVRLFLRHAQGYTPTEAALELQRVAEHTEIEIERIAQKILLTDGDYEASITLTAVPALRTILVHVLKEIHVVYPKLRLNFLANAELMQLEKGEADIAIRAGPKPDNPEYVVQSLETISWALYASPSYAARHGVPDGEAEFGSHYFAGPLSHSPKLRFLRWIQENAPPSNIVIKSTDDHFLESCVLNGLAIGFMNVKAANQHPGLIQVMPPRSEWQSNAWLVTHVDQHRLPKVQACLGAIKSVFRTMSSD